LVLAGPIASIDLIGGSFTSLGQNIVMTGSELNAFRVGDFVEVSGSLTGAGLITADSVVLSGQQYVPGATEIFVTGIPTSVDFTTGTARIGGLTVDYTPSLGSDRFEGIGAAITAVGTQPAFGGVMISDRVFDRTAIFLGD
jgi:hypothetical protein